MMGYEKVMRWLIYGKVPNDRFSAERERLAVAGPQASY
jgi:hypothetical protein